MTARIRTRLTLAAVIAIAAAPVGSAPAAVHATEGYAALIAQIRSGIVIRAVINTIGQDVKVTFRDGTDDHEAGYPPGAVPRIVAILNQHHVRIRYARKPKPRHVASHHHHLRYVLGGVAVGLLAIGAGGLLWRRRAARGGPRL